MAISYGGGVETLLNQGYSPGDDYEIILVNDASTDHTLREMQRYAGLPGVVIINKERNGGVSAARNAGLDAARGELVWFIDPDDFIPPRVLPRLWQTYAACPGAQGVAITLVRVREQSTPDRVQLFDGLRLTRGICARLVQRTFMLEHRIRFDERMQYSEDTLFHFFLVLHRARFATYPDVAYYYRQRAGSLMHALNRERQRRDVYTLLSVYKQVEREAAGGQYPGQLPMVQGVINQCVWAVLMSNVHLPVRESDQALRELTSMGVYPYRTLWSGLNFRQGAKNFLINLLTLFFSHAAYYRLVNRVVRLLRSRPHP